MSDIKSKAKFVQVCNLQLTKKLKNDSLKYYEFKRFLVYVMEHEKDLKITMWFSAERNRTRYIVTAFKGNQDYLEYLKTMYWFIEGIKKFDYKEKEFNLINYFQEQIKARIRFTKQHL